MSEETQGSDYCSGLSFMVPKRLKRLFLRGGVRMVVLIHRFGHLIIISFLLRIPLPMMHLTFTMHILLCKGIRW